MQKCLLEVGEMILVRSGVNTGDCAIVSDSLAGSYGAYDLILHFTNEVIPLFVSTFLNTEVGRIQLNVLKDRSAQSHLNAEEISSILISKPPIEIQRSLVAEIEAARQIRKQKLAQADKLLSSLDTYLLARIGLSNYSNSKVSNDLKCFAVRKKDVFKNLGFNYASFATNNPFKSNISESAEVLPLKELLISPLMNGVFKKKDFYGKGVKLVNVSDLYQDIQIDISTLERVEVEGEELDRYAVKEGDFFFCRSSLKPEGIAWTAYISQVSEPTVFECHLIRARPNKAKVEPAFLSQYCRSLIAREYLIAHASVTTMATIDQPAIENLPVLLPPMDVQRSIVIEIEKRRADAQRLRQEAETEWEAAKTHFERQLLGEVDP
jgi:restriction endonuclease S subunit